MHIVYYIHLNERKMCVVYKNVLLKRVECLYYLTYIIIFIQNINILETILLIGTRANL